MVDFDQYVKSHLCRRITVGQSGADVYELDDSCIAKHIRRSELKNDALWDSSIREALFYAYFSSKAYPFLPEIRHCCRSDQEIQIIMKKYQPLDPRCLDDTVLEKVLAVLAQIHSLPIPDFLPRTDAKPLVIKSADLSLYRRGWETVLEEHGQVFSKNVIFKIAENINAFNQKRFSAKQWCCHGDFHFGNLLTDEHENILVCDWQGVGLGHVSGDLSFLLSRLSADGYPVSKEKAIRTYCKYSDTNITEEEIAIQMSLANLNTSFMFWHNYLHGSSQERVHDIFDQMVEDMNVLSSIQHHKSALF